jgi:hypothetical protein
MWFAGSSEFLASIGLEAPTDNPAKPVADAIRKLRRWALVPLLERAIESRCNCWTWGGIRSGKSIVANRREGKDCDSLVNCDMLHVDGIDLHFGEWGDIPSKGGIRNDPLGKLRERIDSWIITN